MTRFIVFTVVLVAFSSLFHAMVHRWAIDAFPRLAPHRHKIAAVMAFFVVAAPSARLLARRFQGGLASTLYAAVTIEAMIVILSAPLLLLVRRVARWREARAKAKGQPEPAAISRRQAIEAIGGSVTLAFNATALGWGAVRGRHAFELEEVAVRIPGLPKALDGYTLVQISDIHVGTFIGDRELDEGFELVKKAKPDLVVVTGDMIDFDPSYGATWARAIQRLTARDGVVTILGNHDYYAGARAVREAVEGVGARVLLNQGMVVRAADGGGFALLGVDDPTGASSVGAGPNLDAALRMVPEDRARILLSHQPRTVDLWPGRIALQLSGHTHGGQVNFPGGKPRPADVVFRYVAGRYEVGGTTLWVNRGFGIAGPPTRVGAPPEVTKVVLVAG